MFHVKHIKSKVIEKKDFTNKISKIKLKKAINSIKDKKLLIRKKLNCAII